MTDFGFDISCTTGMRTARFSRGPRLVAEACFRRLTTARGMLQGGEDEDDYGLDLEDLIGTVSTPAEVAALPSRIQNELLKDERLLSCVAKVTSTTSGPSTTWNIDITGQTAEGPFTLTIGVSGVTVDLLGIRDQ
jgi:hypothetical protein